MVIRYMIQAGDPINGSGTTTGELSPFSSTDPLFLALRGTYWLRTTSLCSAWSLTYLFLHAKKAFVSKRPGPIALASAVGLQAATYGYYYSIV